MICKTRVTCGYLSFRSSTALRYLLRPMIDLRYTGVFQVEIDLQHEKASDR
jgi:hypothetical protein